MTRHTFLESFDTAKPAHPSSPAQESNPASETARTNAYEEGYASGWDDAIASDKTARNRVDAEFERNIQKLAFSYNEALERTRSELKNFVEAVLDQFIPPLLPSLLKEHVRSELTRIAEESIDVPVELVASPDCSSLIQELLEADFPLDIKFVEETSLATGQVFVRMQDREVSVHLSPLVEALEAQFKALQDSHSEKEGTHG